MSRKLFAVVALAAALAVGFALQPVIAHGGGNSFDDHWLAAACPHATSNGRVWNTPMGPAVGHRPGEVGDVVLYCNVDADDFHNWLQFHAVDNTANGSITVTVYEQENWGDLSPRVALATLTSTDQPGIQTAELFVDPPLEFFEFDNLYYVEIVISRSSTSARVMILDVSLRDVL